MIFKTENINDFTLKSDLQIIEDIFDFLGNYSKDELINTGITVTYKEKVESTSTYSHDSSKSSSSVFINLANAYLLLGFFLI